MFEFKFFFRSVENTEIEDSGQLIQTLIPQTAFPANRYYATKLYQLPKLWPNATLRSKLVMAKLLEVCGA